MVKKTTLFNFDLQYEDDAKDGLYHLRERLEPAEAKVFFEAARRARTKSCEFEDKAGRNYTLWYKENNNYILTRRKE
jgi:hypothetical protein